MTTQQWIRRVAPITIGLILIILLALSCNVISQDAEVPRLSDANQTYASLGDLSISNEEMYTELVNLYGTQVMNYMIAEDLLTNGDVNYVERAKNDSSFNIQEELERAIYGMPYSEALITFSEAQILTSQDQFEITLVQNGFDSEAQFIEELYLERARELYTLDQILEGDQVTALDVATYYEEEYYNDVCAIVIRYDSLDGAVAAMNDAGLEVLEFGNFFTIPDTQTILTTYIDLYNQAYGASLSFEDGVFSGCDESLTYTYDELAEDNQQLADLLFKELSGSSIVDPEFSGSFVSYTEVVELQRGNDSSFILVHKISGDELQDFQTLFPELTTEEYSALLVGPASALTTNRELVDEIAAIVAQEKSESDAEKTAKMNQLFLGSDLDVFDPFLRLSVLSSMFEVAENNGHPSMAFRYNRGDEVIQVMADEFFAELQRYAPVAVTSLLTTQVALQDRDNYEAIVTSELTDGARAQLQQFKDSFFAGEYEEFGFSPQVLRWEEFLYLGFGYRTELQLYNRLIEQEVLGSYVANLGDNPDLIDTYYNLMVEDYNEDFEISVYHFLIHRDDNNDGQPDPLLPGTWSASQRAQASDLADALRDALEARQLDEEITITSLNSIVDEYRASFSPEDVWYEFKQAGFLVLAEDLGDVGPEQMVAPFEAELFAMYTTMVSEVARNLISPNNVESSFGVHMVYAHNYSPKLDAYPTDNALSIPSRDDVRRFAEGEESLLSEDVITFLVRYFSPLKSSYTGLYQNVLLAQARSEYGTLSFSDSNQLERYNALMDVYLLQATITFDPRR
jgi:hypothetical protein